MHCYICDFSESVTSDTYGVLEGVDSVGNKVLLDERHDKYICVDCLGSSLSNYRSLVSTPPSLEPGEVDHVILAFEEDTRESKGYSTDGLSSDYSELGIEGSPPWVFEADG